MTERSHKMGSLDTETGAQVAGGGACRGWETQLCVCVEVRGQLRGVDSYTTWVLGIELRLPGLHHKHFTC